MSHARILAVDDDPRQLSSIKRVLRRSGYEVQTAQGGRLGLRMSAAEPPDLILLDVSMPSMSGHEFLRRFRRLEQRLNQSEGIENGIFAETPVIFLTALRNPDQQVSGLEAGAHDYLTKPYDAEELRARVRLHLRRSRRVHDALELSQTELVTLLAAIDLMQDSARSCRDLIRTLDDCLMTADSEPDPAVQRDAIGSARMVVSDLAHALSDLGDQM